MFRALLCESGWVCFIKMIKYGGGSQTCLHYSQCSEEYRTYRKWFYSALKSGEFLSCISNSSSLKMPLKSSGRGPDKIFCFTYGFPFVFHDSLNKALPWTWLYCIIVVYLSSSLEGSGAYATPDSFSSPLDQASNPQEGNTLSSLPTDEGVSFLCTTIHQGFLAFPVLH